MRFIVMAALAILSSAAAQAARPNWSADSKTGCKVWNPRPIANETISWTGICGNGLAQGQGLLQWYQDGKPNGTFEGEFRDGKLNGRV
jgi:hypothetical protein